MIDEEKTVLTLKQQVRRFYLDLTITAVLFILGFFLWHHYTLHGILESLIPAAMVAGFYWGCLLLFPTKWGRPTSTERAQWFTMLLWVLYFALKVILAFLIGVFVGIYQIGRGVQRMRDARVIE